MKPYEPHKRHTLWSRHIIRHLRHLMHIIVLVGGTLLFALLCGGVYEPVFAAPPSPPTTPLPSPAADRYATVEEIEAFLQEMATTYPTLARVETFGESWEYHTSGGERGYQLWAIRITNQDTAPSTTPDNGGQVGRKPVFTLAAAIHARELTSAELATRFISYLLTNYHIDPTVTWLLNEREIVVIPMVNPDGRKIAEEGFLQRKNVNNTNGDECSIPPHDYNHYGVDLNRNFSFQWGAVDSPATDPCAVTYPGTEAASEPETQALQAYLTSLYPDHPAPKDETPAPDDTAGVLISLHSYSNLVLWPWGYVGHDPPNGEGLTRLGETFATLNGYEPGQAVTLYPTSGTVEDWAYANLGIAPYTFEVGPTTMDDPQCGGFMPPYSCLDEAYGGGFWPRNLPTFLYAAKVARAPYRLPAGPMVDTPTVVSSTLALTITAPLVSKTTTISTSEMALGSSVWYSTTTSPVATYLTVALTATNGLYDEVRETATVTLPLSTLAPLSPTLRITQTDSLSPTLLLIRAQDSDGIWGPYTVAWSWEPHAIAEKPDEEPDEEPDEQIYRLWLPYIDQRPPS